jgi:hypothetical protein
MRQKLSLDKWNQASEFIRCKARPIERALYDFYFQQGSKELVYQEMQKYQNMDGGFGHGFEPDFLLPESSPMASTIALQIMSDLEAPFTHPLVQSTISYLLSTLDREHLVWSSRPETVNDYLHTPWWHVEESRDELSFIKQNAFNPTAELLGYLWEYQAIVPQDLLQELTEATIKRLSDFDYEMHDMLCVKRLIERLPQNYQEQMIPFLKEYLDHQVMKTKEEWLGYGVTPLTFVESQKSIAFPMIDLNIIEENLDFLIESQNKDGSWNPTWPEAAYDKEHWVTAKPAWQGILTLKYCRILADFNRIDKDYQ